jgi:anti-anti-sigma factor
VVVIGDLDLATAPQLEQALQKISGSVIIDCRSLTFIEAAGIAVLVRALRHVQGLKLANASSFARRVLTIVGLAATFLDDLPPEPLALQPRQRRLAHRASYTGQRPPTAQAS